MLKSQVFLRKIITYIIETGSLSLTICLFHLVSMQNYSYKVGIVSFCGSERLRSLPKITWPISDGAGLELLSDVLRLS